MRIKRYRNHKRNEFDLVGGPEGPYVLLDDVVNMVEGIQIELTLALRDPVGGEAAMGGVAATRVLLEQLRSTTAPTK